MHSHPDGVPQAQNSLIVCLAILLVIAADTRGDGVLPLGTLSGRVISTDGKPITAARVWIDTYGTEPSAPKLLAEALTDADGRFQLGPIEPIYRHRSDLLVEADGFARMSVMGGMLSVYAGQDHAIGTLTLDQGRVFTGQVLNADGTPLPGATVLSTAYRYYRGHSMSDIGPGEAVITDNTGRFRTTPLPVGHFSLSVKALERRSVQIASQMIAPGGAEELGVIRLEPDVPLIGIVRDESGKPIPDARITSPFGFDAATDVEGRFTLRGFGPNPTFPMSVSKNGFARISGTVTVSDGGVSYRHQGEEVAPAKELTVALQPIGWIEGQVVDAETGEPILLDRIVVCTFQREPNGEIILSACRNGDFEQPEPGRFRTSFSTPNEYHLTFTATGYHDAEAYTPKVTDLATIRGITVRMKRKTKGSFSDVAKQTISGTVARAGMLVESGWVALWSLPDPSDPVNSPVMRGRTVVGGPFPVASALIRDGLYTLDVPHQSEDWYVVVEQPGHALTQIGPIAVALNEHQTRDIAAEEGGRIHGRVVGVPAGWEGHVWVVAFSKTSVRQEVRVNRNGDFVLPPLPPGEYGLKVGHDAYADSEVYPRWTVGNIPREAWTQTADPWKRAKLVTVEAARDTAAIEVEYPH